MDKLSNKIYHKVVARVDRYFTYTEREEDEDCTGTWFFDLDNHRAVHVTPRWLYAHNNASDVRYYKRIQSFADVNAFLHIVRLMG